MKRKRIGLLLCGVMLAFSAAAGEWALFRDPVVDLTLHPFSQYSESLKRLDVYSPEQGKSCIRSIQGLFNELVEVIYLDSETGDVAVNLPHCFYADAQTGGYKTTYWTERKRLIFLDELSAHGLEWEVCVPPAISFKDPLSVINDRVVVLCEPWHDSLTNRTYSAGTRFVKAGYPFIDGCEAVFLLDGESLDVQISQIPMEKIMQTSGLDYSVRRLHFIALLRRWADHSDGCIPVVWGGMSFVDRVCPDDFKLETDGDVSFWSRPCSGLNPAAQAQPAGFDVSGLILRAAHICGIPFFYRLSYTIGSLMQALRPDGAIEPGDLLWAKCTTNSTGSVFVLSGKNAAGMDCLIEPAGYSAGYGCVHEIVIAARIKGISDYHELKQRYDAGLPLVFCSYDGTTKMANEWKILKLPLA